MQVIFDDLIKLFQTTPEGQQRTAQITERLLALDWRIKGRYGLLGKLARILGSEALLQQSPQLKVRRAAVCLLSSFRALVDRLPQSF